MPSFDLIKTYVKTDDGISTTPQWVVAVVRFEHQVTFDRSDDNIGDRSFDNSDDYSIKEKAPLIIESDCIQLSTFSAKGQHVSSLNAVLLPSKNYENEINNGD